MKKHSLWVLPAAVALALTGCSSSDAESGNNAAGTEASQGQEGANAPAEEASGVAALSAEQAAAVATALAGDAPNAQVMDSDALAAAMPSAKGMIEQMDIKPEKCAEFVSQQGTQDLGGINMAAAIIVGEAGQTKSYSVAGYEDSSKLDAVKELAGSADLQGCDEFSMSVSGQSVDASAKIIDAKSDADSTIVTHTSMSLNGNEIPGGSYQIQGVIGDNVIAISDSGAGEQSQDEAVEALVGELNKAVDEVEAATK